MLARVTIHRVGVLAYQILKSNSITHSSKQNIPSASRLYSTNVTTQRCRWYSQQTNTEEMQTVDYDYVKRVTTNKDILIVDVREPDEIKEHGKIPNSVNIPLSTVSAALGASEKEFQQSFNREKPNANTEIIFYCMIGKRSGKAQQNALKLGFNNVKNYVGSWTDWATRSQ